MATSEASGSSIGVRELLEAGLHFGHQTKRWNPKMKKFIFGKRNGIHIIDLTKSLQHLQDALEFAHEIVLSGRRVLFVGTKKQAQSIIRESAAQCGQPFVSHRWLGGTLTNSPTIRSRVKRMRSIEDAIKKDNLAGIPKKEASAMRHELEKLQRNLSGIADMSDLPGAMFVVDVNREAIAVKEANRLGIPVLAIVDTNCDPDPIDHVIPGNDDALRAIQLVAGSLAETLKHAASEFSRVAVEAARKREAQETEAREKQAAFVAASASASAATAGDKAEPVALKPAPRPRKKADEPKAPRASKKADDAAAPAAPVETVAPAAPAADAPATPAV